MATIMGGWIIGANGMKAVNVESGICIEIEELKDQGQYHAVAFHLANTSQGRGAVALELFTSPTDAKAGLEKWITSFMQQVQR